MQLSEYVQNLMEEKSLNVYRVSKHPGINRRSLDYLVKGVRLPKYEFMQRLCSALRLTANEADMLIDLYHRENVGESIYAQRRLVKGIIEDTATLSASQPVEQSAPPLPDAPLPADVYMGEYAVQQLLHRICLRELTEGSTPPPRKFIQIYQ